MGSNPTTIFRLFLCTKVIKTTLFRVDNARSRSVASGYQVKLLFFAGFIDFVIKPTFSLLLRMFDEVNVQAIASINVAKSNAQLPGDSTPASGDILKCRFGYVDTK